MSRFLDPRYTALAPYTPGEQPQGGKLIKLNTNELPYPPPQSVVDAAAKGACRANLYNDDSNRMVAQPLAAYFDVTERCVCVGNGSDEILAFLFQGLCPKGAAFADLTYGFYPVFAQLYGVETQIIPLREDFTLNIEDYFGLKRTVFIANPNAPTAIAISNTDIALICKANRDVPVVIDEAYIDFSGNKSAVELIDRFDNLVVVGTFSKSRALAGARLGYAVANPAIIEDLNRIRYSINPYNVNCMSQWAGAAALAEQAYFDSCCARVIATREKTRKALEEMGFACTNSATNFLFISHPGMAGETIFRALRECDILVRWWANPRIKDWMRVTIGTEQEMEQVVSALREIVKV